MHETTVTDIDYFPVQPTNLAEYLLTCLPSVLHPYWPKIGDKPVPLALMPERCTLPSSFATGMPYVLLIIIPPVDIQINPYTRYYS
jgi:hypothetical protein